MNKTKFLVTIGSLLISTILSACGGGGGSGGDTGGGATSVSADAQMSYSLNKSGTIQASPGSSLSVTADASVRIPTGTSGPTITAMGWAITAANGTGAINPTLTNDKCTDISKSINRGTCTTGILLPDNIQTGTWTVTGTASASEGSSRSASFVIQVGGANSAPHIASLFISDLPLAGTKNQTITLPAFYSFASGTTVDPSNVSFTWSQTTGTPVIFAGQGSSSIAFVPTDNGTYSFIVKLTAIINGASETKTAQAVVVVNDRDFFNLSAGDLQSVTVNSNATLQGTITNASGTATNIVYSWSLVSSPNSVVVNLANSNSITATFVPTVVGAYTFRLTASTPTYSVSNNTTIYALPPDLNAFFVDAGAAQIIPTPNVSVSLNGTFGGNSGAVVGNQNISWAQLSGPSMMISNPNSLKASFIPTTSGVYIFQLTVTVKGITNTAITQVSVLGLVDPNIFIVSAGDSKVVVNNTAVLLTATVTTGTGLAGHPQTYSWVQQIPAALAPPAPPPVVVTISNANNKNASFIPPSAGTYIFIFSATIDGVTKAATVTIKAI